MAYKKYIERNGKLYGPYIYSSKRVDGKVISEYHGTGQNSYKRFLWIFAGIFLVLAIFYLLFFNKGITGRATLGIDAVYQEGESLEGKLNIMIKEGEFLPALSKVVFENSGHNYEFELYGITDEAPSEGDFYIQGEIISGTGEGYGIEGEKEIYPDVDFTLLIYKEQTEEAGGETEEVPNETINETEEIPVEITEESSVEETPTEEIPAEVTEEVSAEQTKEVVEQTPVEITEETPTEETQTENSPSITGQATRGIGKFFGITGRVSMNLESEISGKVSKDEPFIYDLKQGEIGELKPNSVRTNSEELNDNDISFKVENNQVIVTTEYSGKSKGYGQEYIGDKEKTILIDLSKLNISFEKGDLIVKLVYDNEEIISLSTYLDEEKKVLNKTSIEEITELNETIEGDLTLNETYENETLLDVEDFLTEKERGVLINKFGNLSINTVKSELFKNKLIIGYNLSEYSIEFSYDSSLNEEELKSLMEKDRIKWLKDIADSLLYEKTNAEKVNEYNSSYNF